MLHSPETWQPFTVINPPFVLLCLSAPEFPSHSGNEIEPEVRKSRAAVIAPEPIRETLEITRNRVKKTVRLVIRSADETISHLSKTTQDFCFATMANPL